ncbi:MAG: hypothetical protein AAGA30_19050, partial [Planctomycetota bacterium]
TDINFKYESDSSWFGGDKFVIKDISVGSGTIYGDWDPEAQSFDLDEGFENSSDEFTVEDQDELKTALSQIEVRLDKVSISDLKLINPKTDLEYNIDHVLFEGFVLTKGELESLGDLSIQSTQLNVETVPSDVFPKISNAQSFRGVAKKIADNRLDEDVSFTVDFGVDSSLETYMSAKLFSDQVEIVDTPLEYSVAYKNYKPLDFLSDQVSAATPSEINLKVDFDLQDQTRITSVSEDGKVIIGEVTFTNPKVVEESNSIRMQGEFQSKEIDYLFKIRSPYSAWYKTEFTSDAFDNNDDATAVVIFGKPMADLNDDEQATVEKINVPEPKMDLDMEESGAEIDEELEDSDLEQAEVDG